MTSDYCLEDFELGQRFETGTHELTADDIKAFAAQYDPQAFHLDEAAAEASPFKGLAASGWQVAAVTMRLMVDGDGPIGSGVLGAGVELDWKTPARPGDLLRVTSEITDIRPSRSKPDRGIVIIRSETVNQHGQIRQVLISKVMAFRRRR
jgi:acyl dehydratase